MSSSPKKARIESTAGTDQPRPKTRPCEPQVAFAALHSWLESINAPTTTGAGAASSSSSSSSTTTTTTATTTTTTARAPLRRVFALLYKKRPCLQVENAGSGVVLVPKIYFDDVLSGEELYAASRHAVLASTRLKAFDLFKDAALKNKLPRDYTELELPNDQKTILAVPRNQVDNEILTSVLNEEQREKLVWFEGDWEEEWDGATFVDGRLVALDLGSKDLRGFIETEIGLLTSLTSLSLADNHIGDIFPTEIGLLTALKNLDLSGNRLMSPIPTEIGHLTSLTVCYLGHNELFDKIPTEIGLLTAMQDFSAAGNQFEGKIPTEIGLLTALVELELSQNCRLTGRIPTEIAQLTALTTCYISFSNLDRDGFKELMASKVPGCEVLV